MSSSEYAAGRCRRRCELIISYQVRNRSHVLNLPYNSKIVNHHTLSPPHGRQRINRSLTAVFSSYRARGGQQPLPTLILSQIRLKRADIAALVQFLTQPCSRAITSVVFNACLLERLDAIQPLFEYINSCRDNNDDNNNNSEPSSCIGCRLESIVFTSVEVLMEEERQQQQHSSPTATLTTASGRLSPPIPATTTSSRLSGSQRRLQHKQQQRHHHHQPHHHTVVGGAYPCLVRPLLALLSSSKSPVALDKLVLRNVDLQGQADGKLLADFLRRQQGWTDCLELYQSNLGPLGSQQVAKAMPKTIHELLLRYCNLEEEKGVADLIRHVASPSSTISRLGLFRNRSSITVVLKLLSFILKQSTSLRELQLGDSPLLFSNSRADPEEETRVQEFIQALQESKSLTSLTIACCGLKSSLIGPIIDALADNPQTAQTFTSLRLRGSRLDESGLIALTHALPCMPHLQELEIVGSANGLSTQAVSEFLQAAQHHVCLTEFEGPGWLDPHYQQELQSVCVRNVLIQKSQSLIMSNDPDSTNAHESNSKNEEQHKVNEEDDDFTESENDDEVDDEIPLGLWPRALARVLERPVATDSDEALLPSSGLSAAYTILQATHSLFSTKSEVSTSK